MSLVQPGPDGHSPEHELLVRHSGNADNQRLSPDELEDLEHLAPRADNQQLSTNRARAKTKTKRTRRHREATEMAAMVSRVSRAMVRRAAAGDLYALTALRQMREHVDQATKAAAQELHDPIEWSGGYSWTQIAQELGISRQAARQQFGLSPTDVKDATQEAEPQTGTTDNQ